MIELPGMSALWSARKSFFKKLMAALTALAVVPAILASLVTYRNYSDRIIEEITTANVNILDQIRYSFDAMIGEIESIAWACSTDWNVQFFADHHYSDDVVRFNRLIKRVETFRKSRPFVRSIYVYFEKHRYVLAVKPDNCNGLFEMAQLDDTGWLTRYDEGMSYGLYVETVDVAGGAGHVGLLYPLFNTVFSRGGGVSVVTVSTRTLARTIEENKTSLMGTVSIMGAQGEQILEATMDVPYWADVKKIPPPSDRKGYLLCNLNGKEFIGTYAKSARGNWTVWSFVEEREVFKKLTVLRRLTVAITSCIIAITVALSLLVGNVLYKPIKALVRGLMKKAPDETSFKDEFRFISGRVEALDRERGALEYFVKTNRDLVREKILGDLLSGRIDAADIDDETLSYLDVLIPDGDCVVVVVSAYDDTELAGGSVSAESPAHHTGLALLAQQILLSAGMIGPAFETGFGETAAVIGVAEMTAEKYRNAVEEYCTALATTTTDRFPFALSFGVGPRVSTHNELHLSYAQARKALRQQFTRSAGSVVFSDTVFLNDDTALNADSYSGELINGLRNADWHGIDHLISAMAEEIAAHGEIPGAKVRALVVQLVSRTLSEIEHRNIAVYRELVNADVFGEIMSLNSVPALKTWLETLFRRIAGLLDRYRLPPAACPKIHEAEQIILECYDDHQLCLTLVADRVGLSPAYLSSLFKQETGTNFHDYVNQIRIRKSQELMKRSNLPTYKIAEAVGYSNKQSFIRQFKKVEGNTPGRYRQTLKAAPATVSIVTRSTHM